MNVIPLLCAHVQSLRLVSMVVQQQKELLLLIACYQPRTARGVALHFLPQIAVRGYCSTGGSGGV